jgi:hydrogenase maturation protease
LFALFLVKSSKHHLSSPSSTLIIGYGNPDRQDDGVAWHVLDILADHFRLPKPQPPDLDFYPSGSNPNLFFTLQLVPEMSEQIAGYERVCFVDAHTGAVSEDIHWQELAPRFQASPLTHHLTAESLLSLADTLYHHAPLAVLVSIRGYEFEFSHTLSLASAGLAQDAAQRIIAWCLQA